jgi:hypothetical protein
LPRAGTLRRIALALDVSMETLLGNDAAAVMAQHASAAGMAAAPGRPAPAWLPVEGAGLAANGHRTGRFEGPETRFGVEYAATPDAQVHTRERDLVKKLHELLATPLGDPVARIVEESYRLLPQARMAVSYD